MVAQATCPFLDLPTELRLEIYGHAIADTLAITVGIARLEGRPSDIVHRLYGGERSPFNGIPQNHEPLVETAYHAPLLSSTHRAVVRLTPATIDPPEETYANTQTAYHTLSLLCKQVNNELKSHFATPTRRQTSLFVQYPYGLHILHKLTPQLLRQSRSIHLCGTYIPRDSDRPRAACLGPRKVPSPQQKLHGNVAPSSIDQLSRLFKSTFGPGARHCIEKLEMRIYFEGDDSYPTVWSDDSSPIVVALSHVQQGEVAIEIWRGNHGTGVYLTAKPITERKRVVSTVWRRLQEGGRGQPVCGSWLVDPAWPNWSGDYQMSDGPKGDILTSTPA